MCRDNIEKISKTPVLESHKSADFDQVREKRGLSENQKSVLYTPKDYQRIGKVPKCGHFGAKVSERQISEYQI